mgnify:CR=1 FL=1
MARSIFSRLAGVTQLTTATGLSQVAALAAAPLITRLYSPGQLGDFAVYGAILAILMVVACLRFELAIVLPEDRQTAIALGLLASLCSVFVSSLVFVVVWLGADLFAARLNLQGGGSVLLFVPVALCMAGLLRAATYWFIRQQDYRHLAYSKLSQSLPQTAAQVAFGFMALGPLGLILGDLVGRFSGNVSLWWKLRVQQADAWKRLPRAELRRAASRYRRFPTISIWSGLINEIGTMAPTLLLAGLFGASTAGFYGLVQRMLALPMDLVGQSVAAVFLGEASTAYRLHPDQLKRLFLRYAGGLFLVGILPAAAMAAMGEFIFEWIFGNQWGEAGKYAEVLSFAFLLRFSLAPLAQILNVIERHDILLSWDLARTATLIAAVVIPGMTGAAALTAVMWYAIALGALQIVFFPIVLSQLTKSRS